MSNYLAAKLRHKSLCVKDLNVKFCLHFFRKNAIFVIFFSHCKIPFGDCLISFCLIKKEPKINARMII